MCYCGWVLLKWPRLVQSNYSLHFFINYWVDHENQGLYCFNQINFIHLWRLGKLKNDRTRRKFNKPNLTWLIYSRILLSPELLISKHSWSHIAMICLRDYSQQHFLLCDDIECGCSTGYHLDINCSWFDLDCDQVMETWKSKALKVLDLIRNFLFDWQR